MPYYVLTNYPNAEILLYNFELNKITDSMAIYMFAFSNHSYIFTVLESIKQNSETKSRIVVFYAFFIQFFVYLGVLFIAYFSTFQDTYEIFIDRKDQSVFMIIGKAIFSVGLICHIGMLYFAIKETTRTSFNNGNVFSKNV